MGTARRNHFKPSKTAPPHNVATGDFAPFPIERSSLYQQAQAEREEILRLKWIESEKAGHDIGIDRAILRWIRFSRGKWKQEQQKALAADTDVETSEGQLRRMCL